MAKHQKQNRNNFPVTRDGSTISFKRLSHVSTLGAFHYVINEGLRLTYLDYSLDFSGVKWAIPDVATTLAAYLEHYSSNGVTFRQKGLSQQLRGFRIGAPLDPAKAQQKDIQYPCGIVWQFNDYQQVHDLTTWFVDVLARTEFFAAGVLESLEWCINEILDNVIEHSETSKGFVMQSLNKKEHRLRISIADAGVGIYNSLKDSTYHPTDHLNALTLAVQAGVTRVTNAKGRGNGLWGLTEVLKTNLGKLAIASGPAVLSFDGRQTSSQERLPHARQAEGTTVSFEVRTDTPTDLGSALGQSGPNLRLEAMETGTGEHRLPLLHIAHGTGTRRSGAQVRTYVENMFTEGVARVQIDFQDVAIVSSSFADELIGRFVADLGFAAFTERLSVCNMNPTVQVIINRAVKQQLGV